MHLQKQTRHTRMIRVHFNPLGVVFKPISQWTLLATSEKLTSHKTHT